MRYPPLIALLFLVLPLNGCLHRTKQEPVDVQCARLLTQAEGLLQQQADKHDKRVRDQSANLITSAKIAREHHEYLQCLDKSARAVKLLDPDSRLSVQVDN